MADLLFNEALHGHMRLVEQLQVTCRARCFADDAMDCVLDQPQVRPVPLDQVGVVAVDRAQQSDQSTLGLWREAAF
ncbi:MAG: hypothetical protein AB7E46_06040 [Desulfovibrio sp.]